MWWSAQAADCKVLHNSNLCIEIILHASTFIKNDPFLTQIEFFTLGLSWGYRANQTLSSLRIGHSRFSTIALAPHKNVVHNYFYITTHCTASTTGTGLLLACFASGMKHGNRIPAQPQWQIVPMSISTTTRHDPTRSWMVAPYSKKWKTTNLIATQ